MTKPWFFNHTWASVSRGKEKTLGSTYLRRRESERKKTMTADKKRKKKRKNEEQKPEVGGESGCARLVSSWLDVGRAKGGGGGSPR